MYIEYTHPANMYVCVCVVDIHVVHCFYEVRKYKYHSGRVICPNFLSRGMNLEKEKNLWSISLSMTHGPTYPDRKKHQKNNTCTSHNYIIWQCKKLNRFTKSTESVTIMSDLKHFHCLFGKMFSIWWIQKKRHSPVLSGPNLPLLSPASKETEEDLPLQSLELQRASGCKVNQAGSVGSDRLDSDWKSWKVGCFLLPKTDKGYKDIQRTLLPAQWNSWFVTFCRAVVVPCGSVRPHLLRPPLFLEWRSYLLSSLRH